jgi:hypothetical protein
MTSNRTSTKIEKKDEMDASTSAYHKGEDFFESDITELRPPCLRRPDVCLAGRLLLAGGKKFSDNINRSLSPPTGAPIRWNVVTIPYRVLHGFASRHETDSQNDLGLSAAARSERSNYD